MGGNEVQRWGGGERGRERALRNDRRHASKVPALNNVLAQKTFSIPSTGHLVKTSQFQDIRNGNKRVKELYLMSTMADLKIVLLGFVRVFSHRSQQ